MEKKSDIFSELKKEVAKKDVKISSDELKLESEKIQKESTSATSAVFETHKHEEEKLLKQKKMLKKISAFALFGSLIIIIIVFFVVIFTGPSQNIDESTLAAKVNGKYITLKEVDEFHQFLKIIPKTTQSKEYSDLDALNLLIQYELFAREAEKNNIAVTETEINAVYDTYNLQTQFNLEKMLAIQNKSISSFRDELRKGILTSKLFEKIIITPTISEQEIDNFISTHEESIKNKTTGLNITTKEIRDGIKLVLIIQKKNEMQVQYIDTLFNSSLKSGGIIYYNKFAVMTN